jgi:hypothetical protein
LVKFFRTKKSAANEKTHAVADPTKQHIYCQRLVFNRYLRSFFFNLIFHPNLENKFFIKN